MKQIPKHQHLHKDILTSDFQDWAVGIAAVSILVEVHNVIFNLNGDWFACGRCFFGVEFKRGLKLGVSELAYLHALGFELQILEQEGAYFQRSECDVFPEDFIEDLVLLSEVGDCLPVPLGVDELTVFHVSA